MYDYICLHKSINSGVIHMLMLKCCNLQIFGVPRNVGNEIRGGALRLIA